MGSLKETIKNMQDVNPPFEMLSDYVLRKKNLKELTQLSKEELNLLMIVNDYIREVLLKEMLT